MAEALIGIDANTQYIAAQSDPQEGKFAFAYTITITNHDKQAWRLINRMWQITDGSGQVEEVRGEGVVGKQPKLQPGESFRYTSGALLQTPLGSMQGHYEFHADDGEVCQAPIPLFSLTAPHLVH